jgi:hypothetical protein
MEFKAFLVLLFINSSSAETRVRCEGKINRINLSKTYLSHRDHNLFFIVGYKILTQRNPEKLTKFSKHKLFLKDPEDTVMMNFNSRLNFGRFMNTKVDYRHIQTYQFFKMPMDANLTRKTDCVAKLFEYYTAVNNKSVDWDDEAAILHACRVWIDKSSVGELRVESLIILMVENVTVDMDEMEKMLLQNHDVEYLSFSNFDDKGFCICSQLPFFFNGCPILHKLDVSLIAISISLIILAIFKCIFIIREIKTRRNNAVHVIHLNHIRPPSPTAARRIAWA